MSNDIAAPERYPSGGKKKTKGQPRALWKRLKDNRDNMVRVGGYAHWGSVLGLLRMSVCDRNGRPVLSQSQYQAGLLYGRIAGRYRRYHADEELLMSAPSPAFQRGSRGKDNEIERLAFHGRLPDYEREAKRAKRAWKKVQSVVPDATSRELLDEVCVYDREVAEVRHRDLAVLLSAVAGRFGLTKMDRPMRAWSKDDEE